MQNTWKWNTLKMLAVAAALSVVPLACSRGNDQADTQGSAGTSGSNDASAITVTGCVQNGDPAGTYILTRSAMDQGAKGTSGQADTGVGSGSDINGPMPGQTYRLIAENNQDDLSKNVGREVTVTGQIANDQNTDQHGAAGEAGGGISTGSSPSGNGTQPAPGNLPGPSESGQAARAKGNGNAGAGLTSGGGNTGSGGGRVNGMASDQASAAQFLRVRSVKKIADDCSTNTAGESSAQGKGSVKGKSGSSRQNQGQGRR